MRDYAREMLDILRRDGYQAAYDLGGELLQEARRDQQAMERHFAMQTHAMQAIGMYLRDSGNVWGDGYMGSFFTGLDGTQSVETVDRPRVIIEAATAIYQRLPAGNKYVHAQAVLEELVDRGLDLGVQQPFAVVGTVLASADDFRRVARNKFEYVGPFARSEEVDDTDDLPL